MRRDRTVARMESGSRPSGSLLGEHAHQIDHEAY
jgi:hypothetical protein